MSSPATLTAAHLERAAYVYIRHVGVDWRGVFPTLQAGDAVTLTRRASD